MRVQPREATPHDVPAATALLRAVARETPWVERGVALLAAADPGREYRALVAGEPPSLAGVVSFGFVAGAVGTGIIHVLAVAPGERRRGVGGALVDAACAQLAAEGARLVVCEMPEQPSTDAAVAMLRGRGFDIAGRVEDYVRAGVALLILAKGT